MEAIASRRSLLIVEKNRALLDRLARHFSTRGFAVTAVHHPRQAIAAARQRNYEQALIGGTLPDIDGLRLAESIRQTSGEVRVVLLAEVGDEALHSEALDAGVEVIRANPCRLSDVEELLTTADARRYE